MDGDALTSRLNDLGAESWDVVAVSPLAMMRGRTRDTVVLLKRQSARHREGTERRGLDVRIVSA
ncbi:MAG TPA: hypothetical protein VJU87_11085 [Gemmatimonadaceae bacterium]|nr:hypothetical protein [Gemmatimonadaceae bacterium]